MSEYNIFVEGITDKEYIELVLSKLAEDYENLSDSLKHLVDMRENLLIYDLGGTSHLVGFLRFNWRFIKNERNAISVFDGDDAGKKAVRELNGYLNGTGTSFNANQDYIMLPNGFEVEYLFPDEWIKQANEEHKGWFSYLQKI